MNIDNFKPKLNSNKMGVEPYYLHLMNVLDSLKRDRDFETSCEMILLIRIFQHLYHKYKNVLYIVHWKKIINAFIYNASMFLFLCGWHTSGEMYLRQANQNIVSLSELLEIDI